MRLLTNFYMVNKYHDSNMKQSEGKLGRTDGDCA